MYQSELFAAITEHVVLCAHFKLGPSPLGLVARTLFGMDWSLGLPRFVSPDLVRALHAVPTIGRFAPEGNEQDS